MPLQILQLICLCLGLVSVLHSLQYVNEPVPSERFQSGLFPVPLHTTQSFMTFCFSWDGEEESLSLSPEVELLVFETVPPDGFITLPSDDDLDVATAAAVVAPATATAVHIAAHACARCSNCAFLPERAAS